MSDLFTANRKIIAAAFQADQDTPAANPTVAWPITDWTRSPVRVLQALAETDASSQEGASRVASIGPGFQCGLYLRASILDFLAEAVLGQDVDTSSAPWHHEATPVQIPRWATVWEIEPDLYCNKFDGVAFAGMTLAGQDEGETFWKIDGLAALALGYTAHVTEPAGAQALAEALVDEEPLIWAETAVSYDSVHPGSTKGASIAIDRRATRAQGDSGFRAFSISLGKILVNGTLTRYMVDDDTRREVDTGSTSGTDPTATVAEHSLELVAERASVGLGFQVISAGISYLTDEEPIDTGGLPKTEVLGFQTQPQTDVADNITIVTTNQKSTSESAMP